MSRPSQQILSNSCRGAEVFVGGLTPTVTEDKIRELFSACGEITEIRLIKDKIGNSKGFCFVGFATKEAADKAVKEMSGYLLDGKEIGVLPSIQQDTLFIGNLHKGWTPQEFENFVRQVFPDVVSVSLATPGDVQLGQKYQNRGFGFVKFSSHAAAARAYRAGSLSDFVLAGNVHPSIKWAEEESETDPEELAKIKIAFVRNVPTTVDENYLRELFNPYGKVDKVIISRKGISHVGFVHFDKRQDLDKAIKELNDKTVRGPYGSSTFKLQVEVARPMDKKRKRAPEDAQNTAPSKSQSHPSLAQYDLKAKSPGVHGSGAQKGVDCADPYEDAVIALPIAIKERLLRILRLGIATRFDIDVEILSSLKELPESTAISALDQFMLSGAEMQDKGAYLAGLISKYRVDKVRFGELPITMSRVENVTRAPEHSTFSSRLHVPTADSFPVHVASSMARPEVYSTRYSTLFSDKYIPGRVTDTSEPLHTSPSSLTGNARIGLSPRLAAVGDQSFSTLHPTPSSLTGNIRIGSDSHVVAPADQSVSATQIPFRDNVRIGSNPYTDTPADRTLLSIHSTPGSAAYSRVALSSQVVHPADRRFSQTSSIAYGRPELQPDDFAIPDRQPPRQQMRFDPFTGEPYKFDPFTGEPIHPESWSRRNGIP